LNWSKINIWLCFSNFCIKSCYFLSLVTNLQLIDQHLSSSFNCSLMSSKNWNLFFWIAFVVYLISFVLPSYYLSGGIGSGELMGYNCFITGILFYGLSLPPFIALLGSFIQRYRIAKGLKVNHRFNWSYTFVIMAVIGCLFWFVFYRPGFRVGYYVWTLSSILMMIFHTFFIQQKLLKIEKDEVMRTWMNLRLGWTMLLLE
jgi:hypothetical protein